MSFIDELRDNMMTLDQARETLAVCVRKYTGNHPWGDAEYTWTNESGVVIATGYKENHCRQVSIGNYTFKGEDADILFHCGKTGMISHDASNSARR